jgi:2-polyprenyl-3-methyl-5-hydroxy-6-metoxy-1,4-benzoquinol methylase
MSNDEIYQMVARALLRRNIGGEVFVDVGCGTGQLSRHVGSRFTRYVGLDAVYYENTPAEIEFHRIDLETGQSPLPDGIADVAAAVETIEHVENPRALLRELCRVAKPGGWVVVTTPNQLSFLSLVTLIFKRQFNAFQNVHYPAHLTALLETDLQRMAAECNLKNVAAEYSLHGRIVLTPWHYPSLVARTFPRACSDNVLLIGRKPQPDVENDGVMSQRFTERRHTLPRWVCS